MTGWTSTEIREAFLGFFSKHSHHVIPHSSLIPNNDPTLLFINSGMAPLKSYFTGEQTPPHSMLCNVQPCIRTIDIDDVGDRHHLTLFEMLGSWSIGDYFKDRAIELAFELLTTVFKFPLERLYVTVYEGHSEFNLPADHESAAIWRRVGIPESHIVWQPHSDSFWGPSGETGPCGPCTEVFFDTGDEHGVSYHLSGVFDTKRYIEIWNAGVFMEWFKSHNGSFSPLSIKSVDTGSGLERMAMVLNGHSSVYETDLLSTLIQVIRQQMPAHVPDQSLRILADHIKAASFIMSEGIAPSNEGRGYIVRRLIRRCMGTAARLDTHLDGVPAIRQVVQQMGSTYPLLRQFEGQIMGWWNQENETFSLALREGFIRLNERLHLHTGPVFSGKDAFDLVSTYGIPYDMVRDSLAQLGKQVDQASYDEAVAEHKQVSRQSKLTTSGMHGGGIDGIRQLAVTMPTAFVGYELMGCEAEVMDVFPVEGRGWGLVTTQTCFYAESGGQVGDVGVIESDHAVFEVLDTQKHSSGVIIHVGQFKAGSMMVGMGVRLRVDAIRRNRVACHHTATHLLQSALRQVLGMGIKQAGSLVEPNRLRFDFACDRKPTAEELRQIEDRVNALIQDNLEGVIETMSLDQALQQNATAFFMEKYQGSVRVVSFGADSKELCGGTHVSRTGCIGVFRLVSEGSVAKGVRRIVGVTGSVALQEWRDRDGLLTQILQRLKATPDTVLMKLEDYLKKEKTKPLPRSGLDANLIQSHRQILSNGMPVLMVLLDDEYDAKSDIPRILSDGIAVVVLATHREGRLMIWVGSQGQVHAGDLLRGVLLPYGGKGGGAVGFASGVCGGGRDEWECIREGFRDAILNAIIKD